MKLLLFTVLVLVSAFSSYEIEDLKRDHQSFKHELNLKQEEINLKNVEIESLKLSLNEAHEVSAMLFTEGMEITERYTELKKAKAKKCGR